VAFTTSQANTAEYLLHFQHFCEVVGLLALC